MVTSEINYDSGTIVDLEKDTVTPEVLLEGETAHDATGASIRGTMRTVPDSAMLGGKPPEAYSARNLLDNSNFANPVNQRGKTTYQFDNGYTIDRWKLHWSGSDVVFNVRNGYIELARHSHEAYLFQHPANPEAMIGKTYTVAAKCRYNGNIGWIDSTQRICTPTVHWDDWGILTYTFTVGSTTSDVGGLCAVEIRSVAGFSFEVAWIALYEGTYTAETLPLYVPKGYAAELAECMRYYQVFGDNAIFAGCVNGGATSINFTIPQKTEFWKRPSVDISGITGFFLKAASTGAAITVGDDTLYHNAASTKYSVTLSLNNPDKTKYPSHSVVNVNIGGKLALSADL